MRIAHAPAPATATAPVHAAATAAPVPPVVDPPPLRPSVGTNDKWVNGTKLQPTFEPTTVVEADAFLLVRHVNSTPGEPSFEPPSFDFSVPVLPLEGAGAPKLPAFGTVREAMAAAVRLSRGEAHPAIGIRNRWSANDPATRFALVTLMTTRFGAVEQLHIEGGNAHGPRWGGAVIDAKFGTSFTDPELFAIIDGDVSFQRQP